MSDRTDATLLYKPVTYVVDGLMVNTNTMTRSRPTQWRNAVFERLELM